MTLLWVNGVFVLFAMRNWACHVGTQCRRDTQSFYAQSFSMIF